MYGDEYNWTDKGKPLTPSQLRPPEPSNPDKRPSNGLWHVTVRGADNHLSGILEIRTNRGVRIGAMVIRVSGRATNGRLQPEGISLFTEEEIRHVPEEKEVREESDES